MLNVQNKIIPHDSARNKHTGKYLETRNVGILQCYFKVSEKTAAAAGADLLTR